MREFKCYDCQHTWQISYGQGGRGIDQICPQCGSSNVQRADREGPCVGGRPRPRRGRRLGRKDPAQPSGSEN